MEKKIFSNLFILSAVIVCVTALLVSWITYRDFLNYMQEELEKEAHYIVAAVNLNGEEYLNDIKNLSDNRVTVIDQQGVVCFDTLENVENMSNHADRPEVKDAMLTGHGDAVRKSDTVGMITFYHAMRLDNGQVIRVSNTIADVYGAVAQTLPFLALICIVVLMLTAFIARRQTKSLVMPINEINLDDPLSNEVYDEFAPLLRKMAHQNIVIENTIDMLNRERDEFSSITQNMSEGLIILGSNGEILAINKRASEIFGKTQKGHYLVLNRSEEFRAVVEGAYAGEEKQTLLMQEDGRIYSITATPTVDKEEINGVIILILDITEREETERLRREFSANVSHELKTPLTSISGYAEIMKTGIAKPEDMIMFAGKIHTEAKRLITLVEDIMKVSRLDEGLSAPPMVEVDLDEVSRDVVERLEDMAAKLDVTLSYVGPAEDKAVVQGIPHMIQELIYNLCENAIKYNVQGGRVDVTVEANPPRVRVKDTGIGIPEEHHGRIFERFYRVDKSHSKETGGTGLGLSIVKHIAQTHKAQIDLKSKENEGTTIEVCF